MCDQLLRVTRHRDAPAPASDGDGAGDRPRERCVVRVATRGPGHVKGARSLISRPPSSAPRARAPPPLPVFLDEFNGETFLNLVSALGMELEEAVVEG